MKVVNEEEKVLFTAGSEYLGAYAGKQFDALTITDKRIYHLDKSTNNMGRYSTIGVEEIKRVNYKVTKKSRLAFLLITFGTVFLVLGLLFLLNGLAVWQLLDTSFNTNSSIIGYILLPLSLILFISGLLELFKKADAYLSLEYQGGEVKVKIGVLKMDTLIQLRNAIFQSKDEFKLAAIRNERKEMLPTRPEKTQEKVTAETAIETLDEEIVKSLEEVEQPVKNKKRK